MNVISESFEDFRYKSRIDDPESMCSDIDLECHDYLEETETYNSIWIPKDQDFLKNVLATEEYYTPNPCCLSKLQPNITANMRAVLFDWIFEVSSELCMKRETTYYAMSYVDRLLSVVENIKKENYQLVGLSALYLASKIEEIYPCKIGDFARAADNGYSVKTIRQTEKFMLKSLNWRVTGPTVYSMTNWLMAQWDSFLHFHFGHIIYNNPNYYLQTPDPGNQRLYEERYISFIVVFAKQFKYLMQVV